jgi:hypothetical protein
MDKSNQNNDSINDDTQSILSDITDLSDNSDIIQQKQNEINTKMETELNKLTIDTLKDKCRQLSITNFSKMKKQELVIILLQDFDKLWITVKNKTITELKNICKNLNIKGVTGYKKNMLCIQIMLYYTNNITVCPSINDDKLDICKLQIKVEKDTTNVKEELEKQKKEQEELEKQKKEELDKQKKEQEEQEKQKKEQEELEKQKKEQEELKKELEKQKEESRKKKQSIPKNVRVIVWNHYIGEDIIKHKCLCCKKVTIANTNFEVGHVISEKNAGTHEINNLRPICFACNHSMGSENMIEFVVKYGLYIG